MTRRNPPRRKIEVCSFCGSQIPDACDCSSDSDSLEAQELLAQTLWRALLCVRRRELTDDEATSLLSSVNAIYSTVRQPEIEALTPSEAEARWIMAKWLGRRL